MHVAYHHRLRESLSPLVLARVSLKSLSQEFAYAIPTGTRVLAIQIESTLTAKKLEEIEGFVRSLGPRWYRIGGMSHHEDCWDFDSRCDIANGKAYGTLKGGPPIKSSADDPWPVIPGIDRMFFVESYSLDTAGFSMASDLLRDAGKALTQMPCVNPVSWGLIDARAKWLSVVFDFATTSIDPVGIELSPLRQDNGSGWYAETRDFSSWAKITIEMLTGPSCPPVSHYRAKINQLLRKGISPEFVAQRLIHDLREGWPEPGICGIDIPALELETLAWACKRIPKGPAVKAVLENQVNIHDQWKEFRGILESAWESIANIGTLPQLHEELRSDEESEGRLHELDPPDDSAKSPSEWIRRELRLGRDPQWEDFPDARFPGTDTPAKYRKLKSAVKRELIKQGLLPNPSV